MPGNIKPDKQDLTLLVEHSLVPAGFFCIIKGLVCKIQQGVKGQGVVFLRGLPGGEDTNADGQIDGMIVYDHGGFTDFFSKPISRFKGSLGVGFGLDDHKFVPPVPAKNVDIPDIVLYDAGTRL